MRATAFTNIGQLVTNSPQAGSDQLGLVERAAFIVQDGRIAWFGAESALPEADECIELGGATVIPGFVDSHAHPIFAGDRAEEFAARMAGQPYTGGGIRTTVAKTRAATKSELTRNLDHLVAEFHAQGVTTFEAKSGYGLTAADELRSLEIAATRTTEVTLLGAHVVPEEYAQRPDDYVDLVIAEMIPAAAGLAKWIDVFCDQGAFDVEQARRILVAGKAVGLQPRIHANQLTRSGAIQLAVELDCASADHCTHMNQTDIDALAGSQTVATLLPGAEFSTRSSYPAARALLDAGATVALATDCNPGSSYTTSMSFCVALAVREMHMSPAEALWAATSGGAKALRRSDIGHLGVGARADFAVLNAPNYIHLAYRPGVNPVSSTYSEGRKL